MSLKGQSITEYILLIGIVTMAVAYMSVDFKRGIQRVVKVTADQLGNQVNSDQDISNRKGGLIYSESLATQDSQHTTNAIGNETTIYLTKETVQLDAGMLSNASFSPNVPTNN